MSGNFERTTVSFTPIQMKGMKRTVEEGKYPDLTEAIRAAVNLFLDMRQYPTLWHWYQAHPECNFEADFAACSKSTLNAGIKTIRNGELKEHASPGAS